MSQDKSQLDIAKQWVQHFEAEVFFSHKEKYKVKLITADAKIDPSQAPKDTYFVSLSGGEKPTIQSLTWFDPVDDKRHTATKPLIETLNDIVKDFVAGEKGYKLQDALKQAIAPIHIKFSQDLSVEQLVTAYQLVAKSEMHDNDKAHNAFIEKAAFRLGVMYQDGTFGIPLDQEKASEYFAIANKISVAKVKASHSKVKQLEAEFMEPRLGAKGALTPSLFFTPTKEGEEGSRTPPQAASAAVEASVEDAGVDSSRKKETGARPPME